MNTLSRCDAATICSLVRPAFNFLSQSWAAPARFARGARFSHRSHQQWAVIIALAATLGTPLLAEGQTNYTWAGAANGNWDSATNWNPATIPSTGNNAAFSGTTGFVVTLATDTIGTVNVTGSGAWTWQTGTLTLDSGGAFNYGSSAASTFSGALAGGGTVSITAGTLTLSGVNTNLTGGVTLTSGALIISSASALGTGAFTIAGGTLNTVSGTTTSSTNNAQNWNGSFIFTGTGNLNLGTGAVTLNVTPTVTVTANSLTVGGAISSSGSFGITKAGAGTLVLNGGAGSSYSGATTINAGAIIFGGTGDVGLSNATTVTVNNSGVAGFTSTPTSAQLQQIKNTSAGVIAISAALSGAFDFSNDGSGANLTAASFGATGSFTYSGALTPNGQSYRLGGGGGTLTVTSNLGNANALATNLIVANNGSAVGTVVLNPSTGNTFTGTTTISTGGVIIYDSAGALGAGTAGSITVNSGAIAALAFSPTSTQFQQFASGSAGVIALNASSSATFDFSNDATGANLTAASLGARGSFTYSGSLTPNGTTYRLGGGGGTLTVSSILSGALDSVLIGYNGTAAGSVVLAGANTYGGGTTVGASTTLQVSSDANLGAATGTLTLASGSTLNITGGASAFTSVRPITLTGATTISVGAEVGGATLGGVITASGTNTLSITSTPTTAVILTANNSATLTNNLTFNFTAANSLFVVTSPNNLGSGAALVSGTGAFIGTLQIAGNNPFTTSQLLTESGGGAIGLSVVNLGEVVTWNGVIAGAHTMTIQGAGTVIFGSTGNTFSGGLNMNIEGAILEGNVPTAGGNPFGLNNPNITGGAIQLNPATSGTNSTVTTGGLTVAGGATVGINWQTGSINTQFGFASLARSTNGTVVFTPGAGTIGASTTSSNAVFQFSTAPATANGIVGLWAVVDQSGSHNADYAALSGKTIVPYAGYSAFNGGAAGSSSTIYQTNATSTNTVSANSSAYGLQVNGATISISNTFTLTVSGLILNSGASSGSTINGAGALGFGSAEGLIYVSDTMSTGTAGFASTIASTISGTGGITVFGPTLGAGTLILSGTNSFSGNVRLNSGIVQVSSDSSSANSNLGAAANTLTFQGGTLQFNNSSAISEARGITINLGGGTIDVMNTGSTGNVTLSGVISGAGFLTKTDVGTLFLTNAANAYVGATIIMGGTLSVSTLANGGSNSGIGASSSVATNLVLNGGTLQYSGSSATNVSTDRLFNLTGNGGIDASGTAAGALVFTNTGNVYVTTTSASTFTLSGSSTAANTLTPAATDSVVLNVNAPTTLAKVGTGAWVLAGLNTYSGGTSLFSGTLRLGVVNALPIATTITFGSATSNGTLDLGGFNQTVAGLAVDPSAMASSQIIGNSSAAAASTLTYAGNVNSPSTFGGVIQDTIGAGTRTTGLTVASGSLSLTGANTFSGATAVTGGTLVVGVAGAGSLGNTPVTVASGATLQGSGVIGGTVTVATGGFIKGGNSPGTLTTNNNVAIANAGNLNVSFTNSANSLLQITGPSSTFSFAPVVGNNLIINLTSDGSDTGAPYTIVLVQTASPNGILFNGGTVSTGTSFDPSSYTVNFSGFANSYAASSLFVGSNGGLQNLQLMITPAVPEPAHLLLVCAGALLGGLAMRRRVINRAAARVVATAVRP
jgi:fibronectin-binding autotransporter adhesin